MSSIRSGVQLAGYLPALRLDMQLPSKTWDGGALHSNLQHLEILRCLIPPRTWQFPFPHLPSHELSCLYHRDSITGVINCLSLPSCLPHPVAHLPAYPTLTALGPSLFLPCPLLSRASTCPLQSNFGSFCPLLNPSRECGPQADSPRGGI